MVLAFYKMTRPLALRDLKLLVQPLNKIRPKALSEIIPSLLDMDTDEGGRESGREVLGRERGR